MGLSPHSGTNTQAVLSRTTSILVAVGSFAAIFVGIYLLGQLAECLNRTFRITGGRRDGGGERLQPGTKIRLKEVGTGRRRAAGTRRVGAAAPSVGWETEKHKTG